MAITDTLIKSNVLMTGASTPLAAADPSRRVLIISNPAGNAGAVIDLTGANAATGGIPLAAGDTILIDGFDAKLAVTAMGTVNQSIIAFAGY